MLATYHGGTLDDVALDIVTDVDGYMYVTGYTYSSIGFPITAGVVDETHGGNADIFVTKFSDVGKIVFSTYYGGSGFDAGKAITKYSGNNATYGNTDIYITGRTGSDSLATTDLNCDSCISYKDKLDTLIDTEDAFVMSLSNDGKTIRWFTYYGGNALGAIDWESGEGIALSSTDFIYVTGKVTDGAYIQPDESVTPNVQPYQSSFGGDGCSGYEFDGFVAKFGRYGALKWSTYWGGYKNESGLDIALTESHDPPLVSFVGWTNSYECFPITSDAYDPYYAMLQWPATDAFFSTLDTNGRVIYSTFLGGKANDTATSIYAADNSPYYDIYIAGHTEWSADTLFPIVDFPATNPLQNVHGDDGTTGITDGFVTNISPWDYNNPSVENWHIDWSTFLGGAGQDLIYDIKGSQDKLFITGGTKSVFRFNPFNIDGNYHKDYPNLTADDYDSFVMVLDTTLDDMSERYGLYYGGSNDDWATGIVYHKYQNFAFCGGTESSDLPVHVFAEQAANGGNTDAFLSYAYPEYDSIINVPDFSRLPTYLSGNNNDWINDITVSEWNDSDDIIVVGRTMSGSFPKSAGDTAASTTNQQAFITKFQKTGEFIWSTVIGNNAAGEDDVAHGVAEYEDLYGDGYIYVTGSTETAGLNTTGQPGYISGVDAFLLKLNSSGDLQWFRYFSDSLGSTGGEDEFGRAVAVDSNNEPVIVGYTTNHNIPITSGQYCPVKKMLIGNQVHVPVLAFLC